MKVRAIKPGCRVILNEGGPGEESDTVSGRIASFRLYNDGSVVYYVDWWVNGHFCDGGFTIADFEPLNPEYLEFDL